jgi:hypothetical protein
VKIGDRQLGRSGSVMWKVGTSKVVSPLVSVKDRWIGPRENIKRTDRMLVYGPSKSI